MTKLGALFNVWGETSHQYPGLRLNARNTMSVHSMFCRPTTSCSALFLTIYSLPMLTCTHGRQNSTNASDTNHFRLHHFLYTYSFHAQSSFPPHRQSATVLLFRVVLWVWSFVGFGARGNFDSQNIDFWAVGAQKHSKILFFIHFQFFGGGRPKTGKKHWSASQDS